jgi:hypothetical protein
MKILVILGIVAALSCVLLADSQKSVTMTEEEMKAVDKFFRGKFEEAKSYFETHNYETALKLIDSILALRPDAEAAFRQEAVSLRVKCNEGIVQQRVVKSYILVPKKVCEIEEEVEFKIRIDNLTENDVHIFNRGLENSIFGRLEEEVCEYALDGTSRVSRAPVVMRNDSDIILRKGEGWEKNYFIDTKKLGTFEGKFRRYTLRGVLRPAEMECRGERFSRYLPLEPVTIDILPKGCARYAQSSVQVIRDSVMRLTQRSDETARSESEGQTMLFYASFYVPAESLDEIVGLIIGSLDKLTASVARTAMGVLTNLTSEAHGFEVEAWKKWWARKANKR